jgi:hypothetical protein
MTKGFKRVYLGTCPLTRLFIKMCLHMYKKKVVCPPFSPFSFEKVKKESHKVRINEHLIEYIPRKEKYDQVRWNRNKLIKFIQVERW